MENIIQINNLLVRLYTDDIFRAYFFNHQEIAFDYFKELSIDEREMLRNLDKDNMTHFAHTLKNKLCTMVTSFYQPLFILYTEQMQDIFSQFYLDRKLAVNETILNYAACFGEFMKMRLFNIEPKYLFEVVKFLTQKCQALKSSLPPISFPPKKLENSLLPCLAPNVILEIYSYDMNKLIKNLENPDVEEGLSRGYLIQATDEALTLLEVSYPACLFLQRCIGCFQLDFIINELSIQYTDSPFTVDELVNTFIPTLLEKNLIYFR
jgi:hypothetical protein